MKALLAGPTVAEALARPHNGFAILRLALALMVVVSHAVSVVTGRVEDEPLVHLTGFSLGEHAVNGFFAVSGFLVTMSFDRRGWRDYVVARSLRILPGLVAATLVVGLGLGAAMTRLPLAEYVASPDLWRFVRGTLLSFKSHASLPGVFEANPIRSPLGTVWTLKYETICYAAVLAVGFFGFLRRRWAVPLLTAGLAFALAWLEFTSPAMPKGVETALRLPLIFACGACLYLGRGRIRLGPGRSSASASPSCCSRTRPPARCCSSPRAPRRSGSPSCRPSPAPPSIRRPTSPTGSISTAGRSSRACMRCFPRSLPPLCWSRRYCSR